MVYDNIVEKGEVLTIAYARVSTIDQNLERQIDSLKKFDAEKIFVEKNLEQLLNSDQFFKKH